MVKKQYILFDWTKVALDMSGLVQHPLTRNDYIAFTCSLYGIECILQQATHQA